MKAVDTLYLLNRSANFSKTSGIKDLQMLGLVSKRPDLLPVIIGWDSQKIGPMWNGLLYNNNQTTK